MKNERNTHTSHFLLFYRFTFVSRKQIKTVVVRICGSGSQKYDILTIIVGINEQIGQYQIYTNPEDDFC